MMTLKNCKTNKYYSVVRVLDKMDQRVLRRLYELGFTPQQKVKVLRKSLSGGTILVENRGYLLSLRADVGDCVEVK